MKAEHEAERTFDRASTREELCEVIDLLCDAGEALPAEKPRSLRRTRPNPSSAELLSADLTFDFDDEEDGKDEAGEEADELSATLTDLFASPSWLN